MARQSGSRTSDAVTSWTAQERRSEGRGRFAMVLHCHMPYVEGFGTWPFGEEWLWEAVACVYLPLLRTLRGRAITLVVSPVLADQLETLSGAAGDRFLAFLRETRAPLHSRAARSHASVRDARSRTEIERAAADYAQAEADFVRLGGDLVGALAELEANGAELWTSAATHAILPLLRTREGLELQVAEGIRAHERRFGSWSGGFWLPECAYDPALASALADHGVKTFCVDAASVQGSEPLDDLEPIASAADSTAVPIDRELSRLVWNDRSSYPYAAAYRDYQRATGEAIHLWRNDGEPYSRAQATLQARDDAADFAARVAAKLDRHRAERGRPALACVAIDAEVLGHWWYEGQDWISAVFGELAARGVETCTLTEAVRQVEPAARALVASSWGSNHDLSVWDSPRVADLRRDAERAEHELTGADARLAARWSAERRGALLRAARELLALQASDWPYLITHASAGSYPDERFNGHAGAFAAAMQAVRGLAPAPAAAMRNLAPFLDIGLYTK